MATSQGKYSKLDLAFPYDFKTLPDLRGFGLSGCLRAKATTEAGTEPVRRYELGLIT